jgi:2'-5' RNA ligase
MKRLFLALVIPQPQKTIINQWQKTELSELTKPVLVDNLHITLCFLGATDSHTELNFINEVNNITLCLNQLNVFTKPQVLYLGCKYIPDKLTLLSKAINQIALSLGFQSNTPHLYLMLHSREKLKINLKQQLLLTSRLNWNIWLYKGVLPRQTTLPLI